jgi:hypothetical protein
LNGRSGKGDIGCSRHTEHEAVPGGQRPLVVQQHAGAPVDENQPPAGLFLKRHGIAPEHARVDLRTELILQLFLEG